MKRTPLKRGKGLTRATKPMKRGAKLKARKVPRAFRQRRDPRYRRWVWNEHTCFLRDATIRVRFSMHDVPLPAWGYVHQCWGVMTPAHIGQHQATGAPDAGVLLPLCQAAHQFYDEHRSDWERVTRYSEADMARHAKRLCAEYQRETGAP